LDESPSGNGIGLPVDFDRQTQTGIALESETHPIAGSVENSSSNASSPTKSVITQVFQPDTTDSYQVVAKVLPVFQDHSRVQAKHPKSHRRCDDTLGHSLCIKAPELSQAVGTFAWSVNGNPGGDTTLNADGTCANTSNSIGCVWILSDAQQRQFTLNWNNGMYVDTMVLSEDGSMIEGKNQHNQAIKGVRK
jgi:hypothetical protein